MPVSEKEQQEINTLVRRFEAQTGIEAVAAIVDKADFYPEIPWKAYAIGSALGALAAVAFPFLLTDWSAAWTLAFTAMAILGIGASCAAATALAPSFGRLFLDRIRAQAEVRQYAIGVFVEREVFRTSGRNAVLMLLARFERAAVILPDSGLATYAPAAELDRIAARMREIAAAEDAIAAFRAGLEALSVLIREHGYSPAAAPENTLDDSVVAESGA